MISSRFACLAAGLLFTSVSAAADFSFEGNFNQDDDVRNFSFTVGATSNVTLRSWGYAGGVNAAGQTIASGGFDTNLALFDGSGALIHINDDGGPGNVAADSGTGQHWDAFLQVTLAPGDYLASLTQFDNFANGPNFANGFSREGEGNFTADFGCGAAAFCDVSGVSPFGQRSNHSALDILNVNPTEVGVIPEPETYALLLAGLGLVGFSAHRQKAEGRA
jgi:hypothetical protein